MLKLRTEPEILIGQTFTRSLNRFAPFRNIGVNALIVVIETSEADGELFGHVAGFAEDFAGESFDLLHFHGPSNLLFNTKIIPKLILILLFQKVNQKLTSSENFRFQNWM